MNVWATPFPYNLWEFALAADNVIEPIAIGDRQPACGSASKNLTTP